MRIQQDLAQVLLDMGRDIAVPGVELAINLLQELLADLKGGERKVNIIDVPAVVPAKRLGRPPGKSKPGSRGWGDMTPAERSAEMKRRMLVARAKKGEKIKGIGHPRDPQHPGHEAWLEKMRATQKKAWNAMTPAQQKARQRKMLKGRTAREAVDEIQAVAS